MKKNPWLRVKYKHDSSDLRPIYMAVNPTKPGDNSDLWYAAFRDTHKTHSVIQLRHQKLKNSDKIWVWDEDGKYEVEMFEHDY